jgi:hypothetical protein
MPIDLPDQLKDTEQADTIYVTLRLPEDPDLPTVDGQWQRQDGHIIAQYTRSQLAEAVWAGLALKIKRVEGRLEEGERLIREAQASGNQQRAEELAAHYRALLAQMARLCESSASLSEARKR